MSYPKIIQAGVAALLAAALGLLTACQGGNDEVSAAGANENTEQTLRTPWGVPDLSGWWDGTPSGAGQDFLANFLKGGGEVTLPARDNDLGNLEKDFAVMERREDNLPLYKPEYWEDIRYNDYYGLTDDPVFVCLPQGVPRIGPPTKIVQTENEVILLWPGHYPNDVIRIVPIDGREFEQAQLYDIAWFGHSIGHWEDDTLVIETVGFNDESWLGWAGWTHSNEMKVVERIRKEGNRLHWEATVYDPVMLMEPWSPHEQTRYLNTSEDHWVFPPLPCEEKDAERIVDPTVRG